VDDNTVLDDNESEFEPVLDDKGLTVELIRSLTSIPVLLLNSKAVHIFIWWFITYPMSH
jgi:hypothetical protein